MIQHHQHVGLDKLRFNRLAAHDHQRFTGKHHGALGNCPDVAGKAKILQKSQKLFGKASLGTKEGNIVLVKVKRFDILHHLLQSRRNGKAAVIGIVAVKNVKIDDLVLHTVFKIAVAHGQLVKVAEHC